MPSMVSEGYPKTAEGSGKPRCGYNPFRMQDRGIPQEHSTGGGFASLGISPPIMKALERLGFEHPTPIQAAVIPEALAAWYDHVIIERKGGAALDEGRLSVPMAIVDIGGRTTDFVVVKDQGIIHGSSGSLQCGMLDVQQQVANGIQERFDLERLGEQVISQAVTNKSVRLHGKDYDVAPLVEAAKQQVIERIHAETRRQLGLGVELDRVLFVGGGAVALVEHIANWFPHQSIAEHPAFANARGMLKYLRYVCEVSNAA